MHINLKGRVDSARQTIEPVSMHAGRTQARCRLRAMPCAADSHLGLVTITSSSATGDGAPAFLPFAENDRRDSPAPPPHFASCTRVYGPTRAGACTQVNQGNCLAGRRSRYPTEQASTTARSQQGMPSVGAPAAKMTNLSGQERWCPHGDDMMNELMARCAASAETRTRPPPCLRVPHTIEPPTRPARHESRMTRRHRHDRAAAPVAIGNATREKNSIAKHSCRGAAAGLRGCSAGGREPTRTSPGRPPAARHIAKGQHIRARRRLIPRRPHSKAFFRTCPGTRRHRAGCSCR